LGMNRAGQRQISYQAYNSDPDFVFVPGDFVYMKGSVNEYRTNFFPFYTSDGLGPDVGSRILGSTMFLGGLGQHDWGADDVVDSPERLAYFMYWRFPLNGPPTTRAGQGKYNALLHRPSVFEASTF